MKTIGIGRHKTFGTVLPHKSPASLVPLIRALYADFLGQILSCHARIRTRTIERTLNSALIELASRLRRNNAACLRAAFTQPPRELARVDVGNSDNALLLQ